MANITTRGHARTPNFDGRYNNQSLVAHDVLLDIQVMAKGDYFLHTSSAVAEAVIYTNPLLHCRSVHLEYAHNASLDAPWLEQRPPRAGC